MSRYRITLTATDGTVETREVDQDTWDALVDQHDAGEGPHVTGVREYQRRDGRWAWAGDFGVPLVAKPEPTAEERAAAIDAMYRASNDAVVAANRAADRRENRRSYYLRTGR